MVLTGFCCVVALPLLLLLQGSEYGVRVSSHMDRYSDQYTLTLSSANKWEDRCVWHCVAVSLSALGGVRTQAACCACVPLALCESLALRSRHLTLTGYPNEGVAQPFRSCPESCTAPFQQVLYALAQTHMYARRIRRLTCLKRPVCVLSCCREVKMQASVTDYFHEDGYLAENKFTKDIAKLLRQYERLDASSAPRPKALTPGKQD